MDERLYGEFSVKEIVCKDGAAGMRDVDKKVIGEISLKIYINGTEYASLLCLNQLAEEMALGFLFSEGVIDAIDDVASMAYQEKLFAVMVQLAPGKTVERCESLRSVTSGCGRCFTYINPLKNEKFLRLADGSRFALCDIMAAMQKFEKRSELYREIGGVHSVLFHHRLFSLFNEDIGRHNCFDKITGMLLRDGKMNLAGEGMLFVSGRVSSEIITKVIRLGVPVLVSRTTPTSSAVHLAREYNVTLLGYVRDRSGYVYSGEERLV